MYAKEMMKLFYELLENTNERFKSYDRPITDVVFRLLNDAYRETIESLCKAPTFPESVQKTRANLEILHRLLSDDEISLSAVTGHAGQYYIDPENDTKLLYGHFVRAEIKMTRTALPVVSSAAYLEGKPLHDSETDRMIITPYNSPIIRVPGISFVEDKLVVYVDEYTTPTDIRLPYIIQPDDIYFYDLSECVLEPKSECAAVVKRAVEMYIQTKTVFAQQTQQKQEKK